MTKGDQGSLWGRTTNEQKVTMYQSIVTMYKSFVRTNDTMVSPSGTENAKLAQQMQDDPNFPQKVSKWILLVIDCINHSAHNARAQAQGDPSRSASKHVMSVRS